MLKHSAEMYTTETTTRVHRPSRERSLQLVLWSLWTLMVIGTAFWHWHADIVAQRPVNMLGLAIYSVLAGLVGMLAITLVELWLEPFRFMD